jgi:hypothetical protein
MIIELTENELEAASEWGALRQLEAERRNLHDARGGNGKVGPSSHIMHMAACVAAYRVILQSGYLAVFEFKDQINNWRRKPAIWPWWDICCRTRSDYDLLIPASMKKYPNRRMILVICKSERVYDVIGHMPIGYAVQEGNSYLKDYGGRPPAYFVPREDLFPFVFDHELEDSLLSVRFVRSRLCAIREEIMECNDRLHIASLLQHEVDCLVKAVVDSA